MERPVIDGSNYKALNDDDCKRKCKENEITLDENPEVNIIPSSPSSSSRAAVHGKHNLYACSISYIAFTLTDGAARTIVLLHANSLGFNSIEISLMFALYEIMGVVTNLLGGFFGSQHGLRVTLLLSLALQVLGLGALACTELVFGELEDVENDVTRFRAFWWIASCQALNGIAKDLMKLAGKAAPKLVTTPDDDTHLFRIVSRLTGMKNSMKGLGFFVGGLLLNSIGYVGALAIMAGIILSLFPLGIFYVDADLGRNRGKSRPKWKNIFKKDWNLNTLSSARFFLFGSRDVWFEVAAPIFLAAAPFDWSDTSVGSFMAGYTIIYGQFQAATTKAFKTKDNVLRTPTVKDVATLAVVLSAVPGVLGTVLYIIDEYLTATQVLLLIGIATFALLFALNSSVHSYMIVQLSDRDKVAMDLGFYYMANAGGRLVGTVTSGFVFYYTRECCGLSVCLWISSVFLVCAAVISTFLRPRDHNVNDQSA